MNRLTPAEAASSTATSPLPRVRQMARKVPEVTIVFWIIKLLTTALGESSADSLFHVFAPKEVIAVAIGSAGFLAALILQLSVRRYIAWIYWLTVAMIAVFGTIG